MTFHINQKVVCVAAGWMLCATGQPLGIHDPQPRKGRIYIIKGIGREVDINGRKFLNVDNLNRWWDSIGFRPLIEKTLPAELTALLDIKNHKPLPDQKPKRQKVSQDLCGND